MRLLTVPATTLAMILVAACGTSAQSIFLDEGESGFSLAMGMEKSNDIDGTIVQAAGSSGGNLDFSIGVGFYDPEVTVIGGTLDYFVHKPKRKALPVAVSLGGRFEFANAEVEGYTGAGWGTRSVESKLVGAQLGFHHTLGDTPGMTATLSYHLGGAIVFLPYSQNDKIGLADVSLNHGFKIMNGLWLILGGGGAWVDGEGSYNISLGVFSKSTPRTNRDDPNSPF